MLDHLLVDLIAAVQDALDRALLERQAAEERFLVDVFLGDVSFETAYALPGEDQPPRVQADLSIDWPTWSQSAYRSWTIGETPAEPPEAVLGVTVRLQRLAEAPDHTRVLATLPTTGPSIGGEPLTRTAITFTEVRSGPETPGEPPTVGFAVEASYETTVRFDEQHLEDPTTLAPMAEALTRFVSSTLVQLADLPLSFLPPEPSEGR